MTLIPFNPQSQKVPPVGAAIPSDQVHIWFAPLAATPNQLQMLAQTLSSAEHIRATKFITATLRRRYAAAHGFLRLILAHYLPTEPNEITFTTNKYGKPRIVSPLTSLHFNLSHSADSALIAISPAHPLGVDIEHIKPLPDMKELGRANFSPLEFSAWQAQPDPLPAFFRIWTRKEAVIKALGMGLSYPLQNFSVSAEPSTTSLHFHTPTPPYPHWTLTPLQLPNQPTAIAALAIPAPKIQATLFSAHHLLPHQTTQ